MRTIMLNNEGMKMNWLTGKPVKVGYYLCAVVGSSKPIELYWDGDSWGYGGSEDWETVDSNKVGYYMFFDDIPMPESW